MKKVITYGTFDLLHYGHINFLRRAKELGDYLIVGVSTDEFALEKGKHTCFDLQTRIKYLENIKPVDIIIPEFSMEQKVKDVKKYNVDIFCLGDDYKDVFIKMPEYSAILQQGCEVVFLTRTQGISTTQIKANLNKNSGGGV